MTFEELNLQEYMLKAVQNQNFTELTPIQAQTIPLLREKKDVIGKSKTGSGKTYAYGIPALEMVDTQKKETQVLIVCPTRELVSQECDELRKLNEFREGCNIYPVVGGAHMERQIQMLKKGPKVVIGTPGRLCDHLRRKTLDLSNVRLVVLDEADEMLDMGFRDDIIKILEKTPDDRQTALFSATMPEEIKRLAKNYMKEPVTVETDTANDGDIDQYYVKVSLKAKNMAIRNLIDSLKPSSAIIFCNTKKMVDSLYESLEKNGYKICKLHGDIRQSERKIAIGSFKNGEVPIMLATDVAARGIDVHGLDVVFNYDVPETEEYYTHRIGRTGRAGKEGRAFTLINTAYQQAKFDEIIKKTQNTVFEYKTDFSISERDDKTRKEKRDEYLQIARSKAEKRKSSHGKKHNNYTKPDASKSANKKTPYAQKNKKNNRSEHKKHGGKLLGKEMEFINNATKKRKKNKR